MRRSFLSALGLFFIGCFPVFTAPILCAEKGDEAAIAKVGDTFFKTYIGSKDPFGYLLKSPVVTPALKASFNALKKKNGGEWDYDPVTQGNDRADIYLTSHVKVQGDMATAQGTAKGWPSIPMRFVLSSHGWLIDGVGDLNKSGGKYHQL